MAAANDREEDSQLTRAHGGERWLKRIRKLSYDVGTNLLANIIAGAFTIALLQRTGAAIINPVVVAIANAIVALTAVLLILFGGLSYTFGNADPEQARSAINMIAVGIVLIAATILVFAITVIWWS